MVDGKFTINTMAIMAQMKSLGTLPTEETNGLFSGYETMLELCSECGERDCMKTMVVYALDGTVCMAQTLAYKYDTDDPVQVLQHMEKNNADFDIQFAEAQKIAKDILMLVRQGNLDAAYVTAMEEAVKTPVAIDMIMDSTQDDAMSLKRFMAIVEEQANKIARKGFPVAELDKASPSVKEACRIMAMLDAEERNDKEFTPGPANNFVM